MEHGKSPHHGGVLGKMRAYYGTAEFTDRGQLHGRFLIRLEGGMNPSDVHRKMAEEPEWERQFFEYFESISQHHAPDVDVEIDPAFELRTQRPPDPSLPEYDSEFDAEVKRCAVALQRHFNPCKPICFKYEHCECRFGFPHEIVETSHFDPKTKSIASIL